MSRSRFARHAASSLVLVLTLASCDSQFTLTGTPAIAPLGTEGAVRAILAVGAAGTSVTIDNPGALPQTVRDAKNLQVAIGTSKVPVTRSAGGYYTFTVPAAARFEPDVAGNWKVIFLMNEVTSQIVTLQTGSPVQFSNPPVLTDPSPAFLVRGLKIKLTANTTASTDKYQFTWSYSAGPTGPWQAIPGQGKDVEWTPPMSGNFIVKVDAVDRATQQSFSTTTPSALVFVTDGDEVITSTPTSGSVERGGTVKLTFNRPSGLKGDDLSYAWSAGPSPQGPWTVINGTGPGLDWQPTNVGSYYIKTEVSSRTTNEVNTFVSPEAVVFVNEGRPIVTANPSTALRGDRVGLTLNLPVTGSVTWFQSRTGAGPGTPWQPMSGNGGTNSFLANEAGTYSFRVDVPDSAGAIKTFTTTDPVLNVSEGAEPLITSVPRNAVISKGSNVTLKLNAGGTDETNFRYTWYISTSPTMGWTALPIESAREASLKTYEWETESKVKTPFGTSFVQQQAGSYFVRVDASEKTGTNTYTFTSSTPVVTIQN